VALVSRFSARVQMLRETGAKAVELSALRAAELESLMESLDDLDWTSFVQVGPRTIERDASTSGTRWKAAGSCPAWLANRGSSRLHSRRCPMAVVRQAGLHRDMDKRKPIARTRDELCVWFDRLPRHPSAWISRTSTDRSHYDRGLPILRDFGNRVAEVHLSEVNAASKHEPISYGATLAYQQVASMIQ